MDKRKLAVPTVAEEGKQTQRRTRQWFLGRVVRSLTFFERYPKPRPRHEWRIANMRDVKSCQGYSKAPHVQTAVIISATIAQVPRASESLHWCTFLDGGSST
jgi:hypothetical protein